MSEKNIKREIRSYKYVYSIEGKIKGYPKMLDEYERCYFVLTDKKIEGRKVPKGINKKNTLTIRWYSEVKKEEDFFIEEGLSLIVEQMIPSTKGFNYCRINETDHEDVIEFLHDKTKSKEEETAKLEEEKSKISAYLPKEDDKK